MTPVAIATGNRTSRRLGAAYRRAITLLLVVLVALAGLLVQDLRLKPSKQIDGDQILYLSIAHELAVSGRYTDGSDAKRAAGQPLPPGGMIAPLYPALLAGLIHLDPTLASAARCVSVTGTQARPCPASLGILVPLQYAMAVALFVLVWLSARRLHPDRRVAWLALALPAFACQDYAFLLHSALTDLPSSLFFAGFCLLLLIAVQERRVEMMLGAGASLGLATLTRPSFLYVAYAIAVFGPALVVLIPEARRQAARNLGLLWLLLAATAAIVAPWIIRNAIVLGTVDLTRGYGGFILAQRVAYDAMTWREYLVGWVYWLPDFGDAWAKALFAPHLYQRLSWYDVPNTFYQYGNNVLAPQSLAAAGGPGQQVGYLLRTYIFPHPFIYAAVTLLLAWRGVWVSKYFTLVSAPMLAWHIGSDLRHRRFGLPLFAAPALFMLLFNAAVSVSVSRYNLVLVPSLSVAAAITLVAWWDRLRPYRRSV